MQRLFRFYPKHKVHPFVVLFIERDGSTYLMSLLISHPNIHAVYERFAVMKQKEQDAEAQLQWARKFYTPPLLSRIGAIGFKTKLVDIENLDGFSGLLREKKCRIVYMNRRNHVKAVVSRINARRLHEEVGTWNLYDEKDRMPPMIIAPEEFDAYLCERKQAESELNSYVDGLQLPTLQVCYEDLVTDRDGVLQYVFDFLDVPPEPVESKSIKHTSDNLHDVIINFDELKTDYVGTAYEAMFEEVIPQLQTE